MPRPKPKVVYDYLQKHRHYTDENSLTAAPKILKDNYFADDYWLFSDLYNLFSSEYMGLHKNKIETCNSAITIDIFDKLPKKNSLNVPRPENFQELLNNHITKITNSYSIFNTKTIYYQEDGQDLKLSRFACWKIMSKYPNMIFTQLYFLMPNASYEQLYSEAYKYSRIYLRKYMSKSERIANSIAYQNRQPLNTFNHLLHQTFFYGIDTQTVKNMHGIKIRPNDSILNYMGSTSLDARQRAFSCAIAEHDNRPYMRFEEFSDILHQELTRQRINMIRTTGIYPEQDIYKTPVQQIQTELNKKEREFINKFAFQTIR